MIDKLKQYIESSQTILITTHLGADPDGVCSSLLLYQTLKYNFPGTKVVVSVEEASYGLDFIDGYSEIELMPLSSALVKHHPQLLFILDTNNLNRCTRDGELAKTVLKSTKIVIIDHHEESDKDIADIFINQSSPAVTQDVYDLFFDQMGLAKPDNYATVALTGIYSDTAGFVHLTRDYKKTLKIVTTLLDEDGNIEQIHNNLNKFSHGAMQVLSTLIKNTAEVNGFTYSYLDDSWLAGKNTDDVEQGISTYTTNYLRNIDGRLSGFVVYKDLKSIKSEYRVSFRSMAGLVDVARLAKKLGGGGHKPAAGAQFEAESLKDALEKVKHAISEN